MLLVVAGLVTRRPSIVLAAGMLGYFVLSGLQSGTSFLAYFGLFFAAGSLLQACPYLCRPLPTVLFVVIGCALVRMDQTKLGLAFVVPSLTVAVGVRSWVGLRDVSKIGDLSYGIYIYAWPVQQIGVALLGRETPYFELLSITVPATLALAAASWHFIEKKALRFKPGKRASAKEMGEIPMDNDGAREYSAEKSPVGWYVGSYLLRFIELHQLGNDDPDARFLAWENTVIVRAGTLEEAFRKVEAVGRQQTVPYQGGLDGVPVRWLFEGITDLLPIYEPLEDGAEIMWAEHDSVELSKLRSRSVSLKEIRERFGRDRVGSTPAA